jgi:uncharacterized protein (TIGR03437 family)
MRLVVLFAAFATAYAQPLWFEPNQGQAHPSAQFLAHTPYGYVYLNTAELAVQNIRIRLVGATTKGEAVLEEPTGGFSNYFEGRDRRDWHTGIPHYKRLRVRDVYRGIDLVFYGRTGKLEYDFIVHPGADPAQIKWAYDQTPRIGTSGDLVIKALRQTRPRVYQAGRELLCEYLLRDGNIVELASAAYDHSRDLIIDPVLQFSSYLGGPGDDAGQAVAVGKDGNTYIAGSTQSPAAPTLNPFQQSIVVDLAPFVIKMRPDGTILYYAVLGKNGWDNAAGLAVDTSGSAIVIGNTSSTNFPLKNAIQTELKSAFSTVFLSKLTPDGGGLIYSTYFGGEKFDLGFKVALDGNGNAFFVGHTNSSLFPTSNAFQSANAGSYDCFLAKLSSSGSLLFSTLFGGSGQEICYAIAVDNEGSAYITGSSASRDLPLKNAVQNAQFPTDGFGTPMSVKFSNSGQLLISTFFGGSIYGVGNAIAVDSSGNIVIAGEVSTPTFTTKNALQPTLAGPTNGFIAKFAADMTLSYATFLGGTGYATIKGLALDSVGSAYVTGSTASSDFPVKSPVQGLSGAGSSGFHTFISRISPSGNSLLYSTILGGSSNDFGSGIALDGKGSAYVIGTTASPDFPIMNAVQTKFGGVRDAFIARLFDDSAAPTQALVPSPSQLEFTYVQGTSALPAQTVTVSGGSFTAAASTPWLAVNVVGNTVSVSVLPGGLQAGTYTGSIVLTPATGPATTVSVSLTVLAPAAVLSSIEPALLATGSSDTLITIHGSGFLNGCSAQVDGSLWTNTPLVFVDATTLKLTLPAAYLSAASNHTIAVLNPQSVLSNILTFSVGILPPSFTAASVVNAGSFASGPVAPGEIISVFGTNLTSSVTFDGTPGTLVFASPTQVNVTVPYAVTAPSTMIQVGSSVPVKLDVAPSAPGIFAAVPAGNNILTVYATGCGVLTTDDLPHCALPISATVNDQPATVLYAGIAPGLVQGANQVNIQLPAGIASGQLMIVLTAGDASSKPFVLSHP